MNTGLGIGALGGVTWTTIRTENDVTEFDFKAGTGWQAGIWFGGNRDGRAGLMGEISYAVQENRRRIRQRSRGEPTCRFPVLLRINTGYRERDKPSLYFLVGPVFDIQISTKQNGVDSPDDVYEGLEIGLMFGAGFEVARIGIEGRYSWGMKSVLATDAAVDSGFGSTKLNTFSIIGKIRFN